MRLKHSSSKAISSKMTYPEIAWEAELGDLSPYANLWIPYCEVFKAVKGRRFPLTTTHAEYPKEARPFLAAMSPMIEVALLNGDIERIQALADIMRIVVEGGKPRSPIHAALAPIKKALCLGEIGYLKDPIFKKYRAELRSLGKTLPLTVSQYRQFIAVQTGNEYSTPAVRTALNQLGIPIKKDTRGVKRKAK